MQEAATRWLWRLFGRNQIGVLGLSAVLTPAESITATLTGNSAAERSSDGESNEHCAQH